jgi:hypothetical protein
MKRHIENARKSLSELASLAEKTDASERSIMKRAQDRLAVVQEKLDATNGSVQAGPDAHQDEYLELVTERGQLQMVIANAQETLNQS